jgi:hypothetical protein
MLVDTCLPIDVWRPLAAGARACDRDRLRALITITSMSMSKEF